MSELAYQNIAELLAADAREAMSAEKLDDWLWHFMTLRDGAANSPGSSGGPIRHYAASRLMEWEVGNGGFAQAAYNIPEWFEVAAQGYEALGLPLAAARIREAHALMQAGKAEFTRGEGTDIGTVFAEFSESELARLDDGLDGIGWWAIDARIAYVRAHRPEFSSR